MSDRFGLTRNIFRVYHFTYLQNTVREPGETWLTTAYIWSMTMEQDLAAH